MFVNSVINITVTGVAWALRLFDSPVGVTVKRTNRAKWAIALKISGKTIYNVKGKEIVCDSLHPVILPKGSSYSWKCTEPGVCLIIDFDAIEEYDDILKFSITDNTFFINAFSKIERSLTKQDTAHKLECNGILYGILTSLFKTLKDDYIPKDKRKLIQPAVDYMNEHYSNPDITNAELSAICGISTVYFRKTFETVYCVSPMKYLHNLRISKAKNMLLSDCESVKQVSESVGYNSIYHFSKMFKIYVGVSPTEYKKSSRD